MAPVPTRSGALDELARDDTSRKKFLRMMGSGGAAVGLAGLLAACGEDKAKQGGPSEQGGRATGAGIQPGPITTKGGDIDIVNYALTLEYVEARFYKEVNASGMIKTRRIRELLKEIEKNEEAHVEALLATVKDLGGEPVGEPSTRFDLVIAGGEEQILQVAATVENVGASAYLGQAARIESKDILAAALSIHSVEARHAAALNMLIGRGFTGGESLSGAIPDGAFAKPRTMVEVVAAAKPFFA